MTEIDGIVELVLSKPSTHPIRVGIDGFCASGKTTLAGLLANRLLSAERRPIRVSADDFQNPPDVRWQLGQLSPEGFRQFQIDFAALASNVLRPLGPGGNLIYRRTYYNVRASKPNLSPEIRAEPGDVLLLDGLFLHAAPLEGLFDITVFISADFETCLARALARNQEGMDSASELEHVYRSKYMPGFVSYLSEIQPETRATLIVHTWIGTD